MLVVLIDKMLKTQIVECAAVANWVFSKDMVPEFSKCYIWEIVHLTIRYSVKLKTVTRIFNPKNIIFCNASGPSGSRVLYVKKWIRIQLRNIFHVLAISFTK